MRRLHCLCALLLLTCLALPALAQSTGKPDPNGPSVDRPFGVAGRLLLPWGRSDESRVLTLALRNDSNAPRLFKVVFFLPGGEPATETETRPLPPKGSVVLPVGGLVDPGTWQAGSIEIHYRGPGRGRLFGSARQVDLALGQSEIQPLATAQIDAVRTTPGEDAED